ncbi:hypothetical protein [Radiobacillus deserti]|uniref:Uncharacterized protein n=1 Tax=Radiobacillus deserti TaxID=2594883 RepID=A0A516KHB8_9BACI|nr:hypothetical protein [Radiobacillus deserti]QDP40784.1 hypothetical protein FN924_11665 [Radiobacillus deserti]
MDNFDKKIKENLQEYMNKNINFSSEEKENVNEYITKEQNSKRYFMAVFSSLVVAGACLFILTSPMWYPSEDITRNVNSLKDSQKNPIHKEEPTDVIEESEKNQTDEKENSKENQETDIVDKPKNEKDTVVKNVVDDKVFIDLVEQYNNMYNLVGNQIKDYDNGGNEFKTFTKKEDVYSLLSSFMTLKAAEEEWDSSLEVKNGKLFLIPMDGSPSFNLDAEFSISKITETEYEMTQETDNVYTSGKIIITFILKNNRWLINDISY